MITEETCHGRRFTEDVLTYHFNDKTISDVPEMTVGEALEFFASHRAVAPILQAVVDVGLDYLRLGQPLTSLSGGECHGSRSPHTCIGRARSTSWTSQPQARPEPDPRDRRRRG